MGEQDLRDLGLRWVSGGSAVGVTKPIFSVPLFFPFFPNDQNSGYLYDIKFIFGRCHRSSAAETPGNMNMIEIISLLLLLNQNFP